MSGEVSQALFSLGNRFRLAGRGDEAEALYRLSEGLVLLRVGVASEAQTQAALWDRLLRLRPAFFRRYSSGDLQSRVMAVDDVGRDITGNVMTTLFSSFLSLLNLGLL